MPNPPTWGDVDAATAGTPPLISTNIWSPPLEAVMLSSNCSAEIGVARQRGRRRKLLVAENRLILARREIERPYAREARTRKRLAEISAPVRENFHVGEGVVIAGGDERKARHRSGPEIDAIRHDRRQPLRLAARGRHRNRLDDDEKVAVGRDGEPAGTGGHRPALQQSAGLGIIGADDAVDPRDIGRQAVRAEDIVTKIAAIDDGAGGGQPGRLGRKDRRLRRAGDGIRVEQPAEPGPNGNSRRPKPCHPPCRERGHAVRSSSSEVVSPRPKCGPGIIGRHPS